MDKIWWNEQWMGWPIGPHYAASSNVDNAHKLKGRLMLLVPEMDTNVDPASTMQVVNALIRAGKTFELVVVPGANHGAGGAVQHAQAQRLVREAPARARSAELERGQRHDPAGGDDDDQTAAWVASEDWGREPR